MLPSLDSQRIFIGDGGLETTMIFEGFELPCFAAFVLLESGAGRAALHRYYDGFLELADRDGVGFLLDTPTWRASRDWGDRLGYSSEAPAAVNRAAVALAMEVREGRQTEQTPIAICGTVGPRGDAYSAGEEMPAAEAEEYHVEQIRTLAARARRSLAGSAGRRPAKCVAS
jgi:S-methylmethionine-dependent homocysteine/selenocysteine methylase